MKTSRVNTRPNPQPSTSVLKPKNKENVISTDSNLNEKMQKVDMLLMKLEALDNKICKPYPCVIFDCETRTQRGIKKQKSAK